MLKLESISIEVQDQKLLAFDSLHIKPGQIVSLLGPSGSGKSTLMKAIAGLSDPEVSTFGHMWLDDRSLKDIPAHRRGIGYVEQNPTLFPHLNVHQNLAFGLKGDKTDISKALKIAELEALAMADVATLSGGQASRVSLMRTLLSKPRALLLDEPFAALDIALRTTMRDFVFSQACALNLPTLLVTHDLADATHAGGPIFSLENGCLQEQAKAHV